jgi:hypothetical protein
MLPVFCGRKAVTPRDPVVNVTPVAVRGTEKRPFHDDSVTRAILPEPRIRPMLPEPSSVYPESEIILPEATLLPV